MIENILSILPKTAETYFYRTTAGAELDLVIKLGGETIAIEIKYGLSPKRSKGFYRSCAEVKATQKYIVYCGDDQFPIRDDASVISLKKIMQKLSKIES
ncbi:MAG: putative AAA+ superfamily ATPase [Candidatus Omnitrophota bacterium]